MNLEKLIRNQNELLEYMESAGYSKNYRREVEKEIKRILENANKKGWTSYSEVYQHYTQTSLSKHRLRDKRTFLGLIEHFDVHGQYPNRRRRQKILRRESYFFLSDEFKEVIDYYRKEATKQGKKENTISSGASSASSLLRTLQEKGIRNPSEITEESIMSVFISPDGTPRRSCGYKKEIAAVFKACVPKDSETFNRILSFIPKIRNTRKNIQYLVPNEILALKQTLSDENSTLSLRNKAIVELAMNTGLRVGDIAGLTKDSIDWEKDVIAIKQQKNGLPLELPLSAATGNAIHDYLSQERPSSNSNCIFVSEDSPHRRLKSGSLNNIIDKIMKKSDIRQIRGDRRGFHIFRHRVATELLGNGVARPVISSILGHDDPDSLEAYLSADFVHLKECAISIEKYPVNKGVFSDE